MEMNLKDLFEVQRKLDAEIEKKHPIQTGEDRLAKRILALQVELGECANEWRGFKFWSTDQQPRYEKHYSNGVNGEWWVTYPLLEEYVDCLHFALSIGSQLNIPMNLEWEAYRLKNINEQFISLFQSDWATYYTNVYHGYCRNMELLIGLGEMLGFTWEQIEAAYMSKNATNWERQANGY